MVAQVLNEETGDMANSRLFARGSAVARSASPDTRNEAGGVAHSLDAEAALAVLMTTGTFSDTYYGTADGQLAKFIELAGKVSAEFLAKCAIHGRHHGGMKDAPAAAIILLMDRLNYQNGGEYNPVLLTRAFDAVINNGKMLRNFVQLIQSEPFNKNGKRRNITGSARRLIRRWFERRRTETIFRQSIGSSPSFKDIIKLSHPRPLDGVQLPGTSGLIPDSLFNRATERAALYAYLAGKDEAKLPKDRVEGPNNGAKIRRWLRRELPAVVRAFEDLKDGTSDVIPSVPFLMLTGQKFKGVSDRALWKHIAETCSWTQLRMNLATIARHGVFSITGMADRVAARLRDEELIAASRTMPHQVFSAWSTLEYDSSIPTVVRQALADAALVAVRNVPKIEGPFTVLVDISSSMTSPLTGARAGQTTTVRVMDAVAVMAAAFLRRNPQGKLVVFNDSACGAEVPAEISLMSFAKQLAAMASGGTNLPAAIQHLSSNRGYSGHVIILSDNQSWMGHPGPAWDQYRERNRGSRTVTINAQPYPTSVVDPSKHLHISGWSDAIYKTTADFLSGAVGPDGLVAEIKAVVIPHDEIDNDDDMTND